MLSLAVPGTSLPGPGAPDAIVVGSRLDVVEMLLGAGLESVVLACSADAFRHAMRHAGAATHILIDESGAHVLLRALAADARLLTRAHVHVHGAVHRDIERVLALRRTELSPWHWSERTPHAA